MHSPEGLEDSPFRHLSLDISHPFEFSIAHVITTVQAEIKNVLLMVVIAVDIDQKMPFFKDSNLVLMIL